MIEKVLDEQGLVYYNSKSKEYVNKTIDDKIDTLNIFSGVKVGTTTIAADSTNDTLTLEGSNVTITSDTTNDKVTIGITKSNVTSALGYTPPTTNTTYSVATASKDGLMSAADKDILDNVPNRYLSLVGGKLTLESLTNLIFYRSGTNVYVGHTYKHDGGILGAIAMNSVNGGIKRVSADFKSFYTVIDTGNMASHVISKSGGTMTGTLNVTRVNPVTALTNNLGTSANPFLALFVGTIALRGDTSGQTYGGVEVNKAGTADTTGLSRLMLGNNIASGTAGNASGSIIMFGTNTKKTTINPSNTSADITLTLPNASGTLVTSNKGAFTGNVSSTGNISGKWLQSTADNASSNKLSKVCVQDDSGLLYTRTLEQFATDIKDSLTTEEVIVPIQNAITNTFYQNKTNSAVKVEIHISGEFLRSQATGAFTNVIRMSSNGCSVAVANALNPVDILYSSVSYTGTTVYDIILGDNSSISYSTCSWISQNAPDGTIENGTVTFLTYVGKHSWLSVQHSTDYEVEIHKV